MKNIVNKGSLFFKKIGKVKVSLIFLFFSFSSCYYEAGTLGGGKQYKFDCTRGELQYCMESFLKNNLSYKVPDKWRSYDDWEQGGYDFLNGKVFYFKNKDNEKEEMYYVSLVKKVLEDTVYTKPSYVAIRSVFDNEGNAHQWKHTDDFSKSENERFEKRFQTEILDKLPSDSCLCKLLGIYEQP